MTNGAALPFLLEQLRQRTVKGDAIRLGYRYVRHNSAAALARLDAALVDLWTCAGPDLRPVTALARVSAFDAFSTPRRRLLWDLRLLPEEAAARGWPCTPVGMLLREPDPPLAWNEPGEADLAQS